MKKTLPSLLGFGLALLCFGCTPETVKDNLDWSADLPQALAKAKAENKRVLMNFTGSDWCPACIQTSRDVFSKPAFESFATNQLVLVKVDFPRRTSLPEAQIKVNEELARRFEIEAFPTFVLLNSDGAVLGRIVGAVGGGPKEFIAELEKLKK